MNKKEKLLYSNEKIKIDKSKIHRLGVIAMRKIKKGETVFIIRGEKKYWKVKDTKTSLFGENWIGISNNLWIDPDVGHGRYLNHSCNPSASVIGSVTVVALKDLRPGDEITIDYSLVEGDPKWYMRCKCGSKNCRKVIKSVNFLPKNIFNNYVPYVPTYFKNLYIKNHKK